MPKLIIKEFKGINSTIASLQLKPGEFASSQNFRARPYTNYARRKGVDPVSSQNSPVLGIFEVDLDGVTIPMIQSPTALTFNPPISSPSLPIDESQFPSLTEPLDPTHSRLFLFDIEQAMRAIQDRRVTAGHSAISWPNIRFDAAGNRINVAVSSYPATGTYGPDMAYDDIYNGNPLGTKAADLVNVVLAACISTVGLNDWVKTIDGVSSVVLYDSTIFPTASSASVANYRSVFANTKVGIRQLTFIKQQATQTSVESKIGTAQDGGAATCDGTDTNCYAISGYIDGMFPYTSGPCASDPFSLDCSEGSPPGSFVWAGQYNLYNNGCDWGIFIPPLGDVCINGREGSYFELFFDGSQYVIVIGGVPVDFAYVLWRGVKTTGSTAAGVYTIANDGSSTNCSASPTTITLVPIACV